MNRIPAIVRAGTLVAVAGWVLAGCGGGGSTSDSGPITDVPSDQPAPVDVPGDPGGPDVPDVAPDVAIDALPDSVADIPPDLVPDTLPDTLPDGTVDTPPPPDVVLDDTLPDTDAPADDTTADVVTADVPPTICGGKMGKACLETEFCDYQPGDLCGAADASSVCLPRPSGCTRELNPACGCDGTTYDNPCQANQAGTGILHLGACDVPPPTHCGGFAGFHCAVDQYCMYTLDAMCGAADAMGTCTAIPGACPKNIALVCGCNGTTYDNECVAAQAGTGVMHEGACT